MRTHGTFERSTVFTTVALRRRHVVVGVDRRLQCAVGAPEGTRTLGLWHGKQIFERGELRPLEDPRTTGPSGRHGLHHEGVVQAKRARRLA